MFSKVEVNGPGADPLFAWLKEEAPGLLGSKAIKWNFTKFLVDREGHVVDRFAPATKPEALRDKIEALL
jgi:glutathione peroxidase